MVADPSILNDSDGALMAVGAGFAGVFGLWPFSIALARNDAGFALRVYDAGATTDAADALFYESPRVDSKAGLARLVSRELAGIQRTLSGETVELAEPTALALARALLETIAEPIAASAPKRIQMLAGDGARTQWRGQVLDASGDVVFEIGAPTLAQFLELAVHAARRAIQEDRS